MLHIYHFMYFSDYFYEVISFLRMSLRAKEFIYFAKSPLAIYFANVRCQLCSQQSLKSALRTVKILIQIMVTQLGEGAHS